MSCGRACKWSGSGEQSSGVAQVSSKTNSLAYCDLETVRGWLHLTSGGSEALLMLALLVGGDYHEGGDRIGMKTALASLRHLLEGHQVCYFWASSFFLWWCSASGPSRVCHRLLRAAPLTDDGQCSMLKALLPCIASPSNQGSAFSCRLTQGCWRGWRRNSRSPIPTPWHRSPSNAQVPSHAEPCLCTNIDHNLLSMGM